MFRHYLLLSLKVLLRRKFFTFISIVGISLTLLVLLVVTALIDHLIAPMAPETRQARMLTSGFALMYGDSPTDGRNQWCCNGGFSLYDRYARHLPGAVALSISGNTQRASSYVDGRKIQSLMKRTDGEFWEILDFTFLEGRPYTVAEVEAADFVAVINRDTRENFFGNAPAGGRTIEVDGQRFRVVGVVDNVSALRDLPYADIWTPHTTMKTPTYKTGLMGDFRAIVLASNASALPAIREEFNARLARIDRSEFPNKEYEAIVAPFETKWEQRARDVGLLADQSAPESQGWRVALGLIVVALMFVLLPTVNLVNINVSRIIERASEIGIRKAFGASSRTLVGQFIVENVILTTAGGLVGLVLAAFVLHGINDSGRLPHSQLGVNWRVFVSGLALAVMFGVLSGVYPAWRMSRLHPAQALRGGRR